METDRKFTNHDHLLGACHQFEVGSPWIDRYTKTDAWNGICTAEQVGRPKNQPDQSPDQPPAPFQPLTRAERHRLLVELSDKLLIAAHDDPTGFMSDAGPQINKFLDMAGKLDGAEQPAISELSESRIAGMTTADLVRLLVFPVLQEPEDVRSRIMQAWNASVSDIGTVINVVTADDPLAVPDGPDGAGEASGQPDGPDGPDVASRPA